jgi:hypothetical protein
VLLKQGVLMTFLVQVGAEGLRLGHFHLIEMGLGGK